MTLPVLKHPNIPLHTNGSEGDIRGFVKWRDIVTAQVLPYFSFPFKGKAGMGMGSLCCHFYPITTLTLPLKGRGLLWLF